MKALVPQFILSRHVSGETGGTIEGAVLNLDIVGFSHRAEKLMADGDRGAEQLASLMNAVFEPIVATISRFGGDVVGISGDSVTAIFQGGLGQAERCAGAVREQITNSDGIEARIGLAAGAVDWRIYGDEAQKGALYGFSGAPFRSSADAQMRARPQQILVADRSVFRPTEAAFGNDADKNVVLPLVDLTAQGAFVPTVLDRARTNGEFRHVVTVFVQLPEDLDDAGVAHVAALILQLRRLHGGLGLRFDHGDKGRNIYLFWGAPTADERDAERALTFLRALHDAAPNTLRSGAAYGMAFSGLIGGAALAEYTCYGQVTNLAARLMMAAKPGEIRIDAALGAKTVDRFNLGAAAPLTLKGFIQPIQNHVVMGKREVRRKSAAITQIGRGAQMAELLALIDNPEGGARLIWGEAGIGKSRLLEEAQRLRADRRWLIAEADPGASNGLGVIRSIALQILGTPQARGDMASRLATIGAAQDTSWTPFQICALSHALGLGSEDAEFDDLGAEARLGFETEALVKLLGSAGPETVILIEDIHWLDPESAEILTRVLQRSTSPGARVLTLILSTRPDPTTLPIPLWPPQIPIPVLTEQETGALMGAQLGGPVSREFQDQIHAACEGNPFFTRQTTKALQEAGHIRFQKDLWRLNEADGPATLPSDVRTLLVSRIDRLSKDARDLIEAASVIGRDISQDLLSDILGDAPSNDAISRLITAEIWTQIAQDQYAFQHALLREVAYDLQPTATRVDLHQRAYNALSARRADQGDLGFHADRSGDAKAAVTHYEAAGAIAADGHQIDRAAGFYRSAVALIAPDDAFARYPLLRALSEMLAVNGDIRLAGLLDQIAEIAPLIGQQAQIDLVIARLADLARRGDYEAVQDLARTNLAWIDDQGAPLNGIDVRLILSYGLQFLYTSNTLGEARAFAFEALELARDIGDRGKIREAHFHVGLAHRYQDDPIAREHVETALTMTNDPIARGRMLKTLGSIMTRQGDTPAALRSYGDAIEAAQRIGARNNIASVQYVLATHYLSTGDFGKADHYYRATLAIALEIDSFKMIHDSTLGIGRMLALRGDVDAALKAWDGLIERIALQPKPDLMSIKNAIAFGLLVSGNWGRCLQYFLEESADAEQRGLWHDVIDAASNAVSCRLELEDWAGLADEIAQLLDDTRHKPMTSRFAVSEEERDVLRLELLLLRAVLTWRNGGDVNDAVRDAEQVFAELGDFAESKYLIDTRTLSLGPNGRLFCYLAEVLQAGGSPKCDDVLRAAALHIGRLADCVEMAGFPRDLTWSQNVFRSRLVDQCAAAGITV